MLAMGESGSVIDVYVRAGGSHIASSGIGKAIVVSLARVEISEVQRVGPTMLISSCVSAVDLPLANPRTATHRLHTIQLALS